MKKLKLVIVLLGLSQGVDATEEIELKNLCPSVPDYILAQEPDISEFVTVKAGSKEWSQQYEEFEKADEAHRNKYSEEYKKEEAEWAKLSATETASQREFYGLLPKGKDHDEIFRDIKSACWLASTKEDEYAKDEVCQPLIKPPTANQWNNILVCTLERSKLVGIKLYDH